MHSDDCDILRKNDGLFVSVISGEDELPVPLSGLKYQFCPHRLPLFIDPAGAKEGRGGPAVSRIRRLPGCVIYGWITIIVPVRSPRGSISRLPYFCSKSTTAWNTPL